MNASLSLAEKCRPTAFHSDYLVGQAAKVWARDLLPWRNKCPFHVVFWGPPGCGKTTLARMLAENTKLPTAYLSAVQDGVKEIRQAVQNCLGGILFIDEIHRLSKSQQDILLPILEDRTVTLIGATTESPNVSLNPALLSRIRTLYLAPPTEQDIKEALVRARPLLEGVNKELTLKQNALIDGVINQRIPKIAQGDVRFALNLLEAIALCENQADIEDVFQNTSRSFTDKLHYDFVSAMIKSMRGSDPDAALYYAITALDAGEDPLFILRRCVIFASEDIGNADPQALAVAVNAVRAVEFVGMPEGRIPLAQVVTYLSSTIKSNRSYVAIDAVRKWHKQAIEKEDIKSMLPPSYLTLKGADDYKYPHNYQNSFVNVEYLPLAIAKIKKIFGAAYIPKDVGVESRFLMRLKDLWKDVIK